MEGDTTSIRGSYLGTVVQGGPTDELTIWNWKTGSREWGMPMDKGVGQWCFLDDTHILFPKNVFVGNPALRARQRRLHVRTFRSGAADLSEERIFVLPDPRNPLGSSMGARLLSRPTPSPTAATTTVSSTAPGELFHPSAEDHVLTVELWAYYSSSWEVTDLHIPTRVLLSHHAQGNISTSTSIIIPWDAWRNAITQSPPLEQPRDMAPLGPLAHGMRRLCWNCGTTNSRSSRSPRVVAASMRSAVSPAPDAPHKAVSVWDLHRGRTERALSALMHHDENHHASELGADGPAAIERASCPCGGGEDLGLGSQTAPSQGKERPYIHSEVPLPQEIQEADPVGIKFAMCGDALVVLEVSMRASSFDLLTSFRS